MSDDSKVANILERFAARKPAEAPVEATVHSIKGKKPYIAAEIDQSGERVHRLKIYFSNGDINVPSYAYLSNAFLKSDTYIGMVFSIGGVEVKGRNLGKLIDALQDERIRVLRYFDPEQHEPPAPDEPFIESIAML